MKWVVTILVIALLMFGAWVWAQRIEWCLSTTEQSALMCMLMTAG